MGRTCVVREERGKQKPRSCRAQELARSRAQWRGGMGRKKEISRARLFGNGKHKPHGTERLLSRHFKVDADEERGDIATVE